MPSYKLEIDIEKMLVDACNVVGIRCIKGVAEGNKGYFDRIIYNTILQEIHYIEIKNNTYYTRNKRQKEWADIVKACKGKYFLIDGEEEMEKYIEMYIKEII